MPEPRGSLLLGDFHPHLESAFAERLRALPALEVARALTVVVPNRFLAIHLRRRAAVLGAPSLGLRVIALEDWIGELATTVESDRRAPTRSLPGWASAMLLTERLAPRWTQAPDGYFAQVADKPGLYRAVAATLRDLRDAAVDPDRLAQGAAAAFAEGSHERRKLAQVELAYRSYLAVLAERGLMDDRRRTELAIEALRRDPAVAPRRLWIYGFYDLVARQRELLRTAFAGRAVDAYFPWGRDEESFRFARPLRRWFEEQGLAPHRLYEQEGAPAGLGGALARLRSGLFRGPEEAVTGETAVTGGIGGDDEAFEPVARDERSVQLLSTPDPARQAAEVVRGLVADPPRSAAVLLRQEAVNLPYYLALSRGSGAALHLPAGEPWRRVPAARALLTFLELVRARAGDHQPPSLARATVEDLLAVGAGRGGVLEPARFGPTAHPQRWPQLLRRLGVVSELSGWQRLADRWAPPEEPAAGAQPPAEEAAEEAPAPPAETPSEAAEQAEEGTVDDGSTGLERELRGELPALAGWVRELLAATAELGAEVGEWKGFARRLWRWVEHWLRPSSARADLLEALLPLAELDGVLRPSLGLAVEVIEQLLSTGRRGGPRFGAAPTVGDLMSLRGVTFDRVVLPDLVERAFPRRPRQDPILLDAERTALNEAWRQEAGVGAPALPLKVTDAADEEKLLFRLVIAAARRTLILSWPRSGDDGRALVPSTFLLDVAARLTGSVEAAQRLLAGAGDPALLAVVPLAPPYPSELLHSPASAPPLAAWELDLAAIDAATGAAGSHPDPHGAAGELAFLPAAYPRFAESLALQEARWGFSGRHLLGEYDGLIGRRLGAAWLATRSRPPGGDADVPAVALSASALERYAHCSFRFFHHDVLGLRSEGPPERRLDQDPRQVGEMAHALLHALFEELQSEGLLPLTAETLPAAAARVEPLVDRVVAEHPRWSEEGPEVLWQARRDRLLEELRRVLLEEVREQPPWTPFAYELAFGGGRADAASEATGEAAEEAIARPAPELAFGEHRLALRGRIDRVDRSPASGSNGAALRVVDYKTGRLKPAEYKPGDLRGGQRLQVALYARAAPSLLPGAGAVHGAYVGVTSASGYARYVWSPEHFAAAAPELERLVAAMLDGLARGEMVQVERSYFCDNLCELSELCGPGRRRLIEDKALDPRGVGGWRSAPVADDDSTDDHTDGEAG
jgi:hypothetical protein